MRNHASLLSCLLLGPVLAACAVADAALTIEQAEQISKRTGRPILAVAGSKT